MTDMEALIFMMGVIAVVLLFGFILHHSDRSWRKMYEAAMEMVTKQELQLAKERIEWYEERKQLLDRIQAQSFNEFKLAEIRMAKVEKGEQPKQTFHLE